jgi:hypothetical protein
MPDDGKLSLNKLIGKEYVMKIKEVKKAQMFIYRGKIYIIGRKS